MKKKKTKRKDSNHKAHAGRKIRLGYLSPDFGEGRTRDLLPMVFFSYDHLRFEVFGYHTGMGGNTEPFAEEVTLRELGTLTAEEAAEIIRRDRIDLLVDLSLRTPDAMTRAIMELHPASHVVSLAADCPQELAEALPTVEGVDVLSRCYVPFEPVHRYTYRAPLLDAGVPTIGVAGILPEEGRESLLQTLTELLQSFHAVRLILPAPIAEILSEKDVARIAEAPRMLCSNSWMNCRTKTLTLSLAWMSI